MSKSTHTARTCSNGGRPQSEIARLAEELARLQRISMEIDCKQLKKHPGIDDETQPADEPALPDGRNRCVFFNRVDTEAIDRIFALEKTLSFLEPETLDDVLTLTILLSADFNTFSVNYAHEDTIGGHDRGTMKFKSDERHMERLITAVIRGLIKFASSPMMSTGYMCEAWDFIPWSEELAMAEAEIAKLPPKRGRRRKTADSTTHH